MEDTLVFHVGVLPITRTVLTTWALMALLGITAFAATRRLDLTPGALQTTIEGVVAAIDDAVTATLPEATTDLRDWIGTLWIFIALANLAGIVPGVSSPTDDLSMTTALALLVFLSVHWFGIAGSGVRAHFAHYLEPNPLLAPFHVISELSRTLTLAVRLFGNMISLEIAALLVLLVGGLLVPVPLLLLHIVEALVQAYIFGMLALVYISGGIQSRHTAPSPTT